MNHHDNEDTFVTSQHVRVKPDIDFNVDDDDDQTAPTTTLVTNNKSGKV